MYCGEYRLECCRYAQRKTKYQSISCILRIHGKSAKFHIRRCNPNSGKIIDIIIDGGQVK